MEKRKYSFYEKDINMERVEEVLQDVASKLSLYEILKMVREISYDMVCYYGEDKKGKIYDGSYTKKQIEQASRLQSQLRDICDLFSQVIVNHNEFDEDYLKDYEFARVYLRSIEDLKRRISE